MRKNLISVITAGVLVASAFTGCSRTSPVPEEKPKEIIQIKDRVKFLDESQRDYSEVEISEYVKKISDLNHNGLEGLEAEIIFKRGKIYTLNDIPDMINFPIVIEQSIQLNKIRFHGKLSGSLESVLNYIATLSDSYWTNKRGIIKFQKRQSLIYSFPVLSAAKTSLAYNAGTIGSDEEIDLGDTSGVRNVLMDIAKLVQGSLNPNQVTGTISKKQIESTEENDQDQLNKSNNNSSQSSENESAISTESSNKQISESNSESGTLNNSETEQTKSSLAPKPSVEQRVKNSKRKTKKKDPVSTEAFNKELMIQATEADKNDKTISNQMMNNKNNSKGSNAKKDTSLSESNAKQIASTKSNNLVKTKSYSTEIELVQNIVDSNESRIVVSEEMGIIQVSVSPDEEEKVDNILKTASESMFSSLINLDFFVLEVEEEQLAEFNQDFSGFIQNGIVSSSFSFAAGGLTGGAAEGAISEAAASLSETGGYIDALSSSGLSASLPLTTPTDGGVSSIKNLARNYNSSQSLNFMVSYLTGDSKGEVLTQPKIVALPNRLSRLKESVEIPYIMPGTLTAEEENVGYQIDSISSGLELGAISNVLPDGHIQISLGIKINQYLGDKTLNAGTLGTYNLPIQAPKVLNTTFRVKPGDIIVLGGSNKITSTADDFENLFIPTEFGEKLNRTKFIILALPRLTKFIQKED